MAKVRVRQPGQHALADPHAPGVFHSPGINEYFDDTHPLVQAHRWAFATDVELAAEQDLAGARDSISLAEVEQATAAPGEKRSTRRRSHTA